MPLNAALLPEFDHETASTRRVLERVPDGRFDYRPHPKSMSLGDLANHLANLLTWTTETLEKDGYDIDPAAPPDRPVAATREGLLEIFDRARDAARASLAAASDDTMMQPWSLTSGGRNVLTMPRAAVLRSFVMNHMIHHRAQLGVYLRMNDVPVPAIYGNSADEP